MVLKQLFAVFCLIILGVLSCKDHSNESENAIINAPEKSLNEQVLKYPDSLPLRIKLVQQYSDSGDYKSALKVTEDGIKRDSVIPDLWDIKASVLYQNEDTLGAVKAFEKAIAIIPLPDYLISIGSLYAQTKNPRALLVADNLLSAKNPKTEKDALFIKGLYYSYTGDKNQSIFFFDKIINLDYTYMFAYREKAISLYDEGKYNEAIMVLDKAVTIENSYDEGYYWIGRCDEKLNRIPDAINNYKTALLYDKNFIEARQALNKLQPK